MKEKKVAMQHMCTSSYISISRVAFVYTCLNVERTSSYKLATQRISKWVTGVNSVNVTM